MARKKQKTDDTDSVPLRDYVDGQVEEVRRAVDLAATASKTEGVPLREHIAALSETDQRALDKADAEREKAAAALREEQARAMAQADSERAKAATTLAVSLERSIREGDERLREHIASQILQINAALTSNERLSVERVTRLQEGQFGLAKQLEITQNASEKAIDKAEASSEKRFESVNEFRKALTDQTATFMSRDEVDQRFISMAEKIESNTKRLDTSTGKGEGLGSAWAYVVGALGILISFGTLIVYLLSHFH